MEIISQNNTATNTTAIEFSFTAEEFENAISAAYNKRKKSITVPGFRKGKAPRKVIEAQYGESVFYDDAVNSLYNQNIVAVIDKTGLDVVDVENTEVVEVSKENGVKFKADIITKPVVEISDYKGLEVKKTTKTVDDAAVDAEIDKIRNRNARSISVEDRAAQIGDTAVIDFEGFLDGVAFEGGKGEKFPLELGSGSFIPGFEEQVAGKNIGEDFDVNVTFPEEYHAAELAGKPATFKVTVKEIKSKELPELNDELVQDISEFKTVDEYKADLKATLEKKKAKDAEVKKENEAIEAAVANATMEIPEAMIKQQALQMADGYDRNLKQQGISLEQYVKMMGMEIDKFIESIYPEAEKRIKNGLVLDAIAKAEDFTVTDEEVEEEIKNMASMYNMKEDELKDMMTDNERNQIKEDLAVQKAVKLIAAEAVEK